MRMTFDYKEKRAQGVATHGASNQRSREVDESDPDEPGHQRARDPWSVVPYQSTHNTGG